MRVTTRDYTVFFQECNLKRDCSLSKFFLEMYLLKHSKIDFTDLAFGYGLMQQNKHMELSFSFLHFVQFPILDLPWKMPSRISFRNVTLKNKVKLILRIWPLVMDLCNKTNIWNILSFFHFVQFSILDPSWKM